MALVWTSHTPGQVRHSQRPLPEGCAAPCSIREWLCVTRSRNSLASAIPCKVQRCGRCRSPAQLCPAGSPGSSHRFPYPGLASTGHTLPTGRRGERVSAWLLAGAFVVINWALPFKGRKESLCRWAPNIQISFSWSAQSPSERQHTLGSFPQHSYSKWDFFLPGVAGQKQHSGPGHQRQQQDQHQIWRQRAAIAISDLCLP